MNLPYLICYLIVDVFCVVVSLIISSKLRGDSGSELQVRYLRWLIMAYFAFVITDAVWALIMIGRFGGYTIVLPAFLEGLNKTAVGFTAYSWFCYSASLLESPLVYNTRIRRLGAIPALLIPVLYVIGYFTGLNIVIGSNSTSDNGPMYLVISLIAMLYLLAAVISAINHYRRRRTRSARRLCLIFISFIIAPTAGAVFDIFVSNMPIMAPCILVSFLLVLTSLQESRISTDALTRLHNRRAADEYLDGAIEDATSEQPLYVFVIDMDKFKSINDTYGHLEGDHALRIMAAALTKACSDFDAFAARWGGDEFLLICSLDGQDDPATVESGIHEHLAREVAEQGVSYELSCTIGYACCDSPDMRASQLFEEADKALYALKQG